MKLYTEEQVKQIQQAILCNHKDAIMDANYCLSVTTPIELPSDEEIGKEPKYWGRLYKIGVLRWYRKRMCRRILQINIRR